MRYERDPINILTPVLVGAIAINLFNAGFQSGHIVGENDANADKRVEQVQVYNRQLQKQLEVGHTVVANLTVDDTGKHFSFKTVSAAEQNQTCRGDYEVRNDVATATGNLACTAVTPVRTK